jgi:hypothetical protein
LHLAADIVIVGCTIGQVKLYDNAHLAPLKDGWARMILIRGESVPQVTRVATCGVADLTSQLSRSFLVVTAFVAFLMGIVGPGLSTAREQTRRIICRSNPGFPAPNAPHCE